MIVIGDLITVMDLLKRFLFLHMDGLHNNRNGGNLVIYISVNFVLFEFLRAHLFTKTRKF